MLRYLLAGAATMHWMHTRTCVDTDLIVTHIPNVRYVVPLMMESSAMQGVKPMYNEITYLYHRKFTWRFSFEHSVDDSVYCSQIREEI